MSKSGKKAVKPEQNDMNANDEKVELTGTEAEDIEESEAEDASETVEEEMPEDSDVSESEKEESEIEENPKKSAVSKEEFEKLSFSEKCMKDPLIPISVILAFVAILVAGIYFMMPNVKAPSLGITVAEFRDRYRNGEVAVSLHESYLDIALGEVTYVDPAESPSILGESETYKVSSSYVDYFKGYARNFSNSGIEGATRKSDGKLAYVRTYSEAEFEPAWMVFSNTLQTVYPDLTKYQAMNTALNSINEPTGDGMYTVRGDYAFRWYAVTRGEMNYFVVEVVPKSALKGTQIGKVLEDAAAMPTETVPESIVDTSGTEST